MHFDGIVGLFHFPCRTYTITTLINLCATLLTISHSLFSLHTAYTPPFNSLSNSSSFYLAIKLPST